MKKILLVSAIISSTVFLSGCWETVKGEKVGTIIKFSREGFLIRSWEGELIRGGLNNGGGSFGCSFHFTIENENLLNNAIDSLDNQKIVKVKYHKEWLALPWRTETKDNTFVDSIEIVK